MEDTRIYVGYQLKTARQEAGLKQEQVAQYLQVATSAVSGMENGQRKVDAVELYQLAKLYNKPLEWFFAQEHSIARSHGVRWYDQEPLMREIIHLLEKSPQALREKAAYGLMGFLSDR